MKKTIRALARFTAFSLTVGILSTVNVSSVNAAELEVSTTATNTNFTANLLTVANKIHATTATASATRASNVSTGLRLYDDSVGTTATQLAYMNASGALTFMTGAATANELMITVSGGTLAAGVVAGGVAATRNTAGTPAGRAANTALYSVDATSTSVVWTPGAVGTYTITMYTGAAVDATFASLTGGTLVTTITVYAGTASDLEVMSNGATSTTSRGIISTNGTAGQSRTHLYGTTNNVGVMLANGSAYVKQIAGAATGGVAVSGGVISSCAADGGGATVTLNVSRTTCTNSATTDTLLTIAPNSGVTSITITGYTTSALATAQASITYAIVAASSTNVFSASTSFLSVETSGTTATDNTDATRTAVSGLTYSATEVPAGSDGFFGYDLKDAYGTALSAHVIGASVTGPCLVGFNQAHTSNTYTSASTSTAAGYISVGRVTSTAPGSCTLTVTDNGTTIATRTFKFLGQVEKLTITNVLRVKSGSAANDDAIEVEAFDSAGNRLDNISWSATSASLGSSLTTVTKDQNSDRLGLLSDGDITCLSSGTYDLAVQATNASLATITSPTVKINCSGNPLSFTASLDKAIYAPGDIATLTITAKDSAGNLTNDYAVVGTAGAATTEASLTGSQMTIIGQTTAALLNAITFTDGVAKFKFTVGSTEGSYNMVVDLPKWPNAAGANQAQTVAYKVKNSTTTITDAEVYASIVKLIATINEQIKALQKSLKKRK